MPKITPEDVMDYTVFDKVKNRDRFLLEKDIIEAEQEIKSIVGHTFDGLDTDGNPLYPILPPEVEIAYLKMTQFFALINSDESITKGIFSERIGDYSYTLANGQSVRKPDVYDLLSSYVKVADMKTGNTRMRMRSI
ncbi:protein YqbG [Neobacillus sp. M.A.Huq-85]